MSNKEIPQDLKTVKNHRWALYIYIYIYIIPVSFHVSKKIPISLSSSLILTLVTNPVTSFNSLFKKSQCFGIHKTEARQIITNEDKSR